MRKAPNRINDIHSRSLDGLRSKEVAIPVKVHGAAFYEAIPGANAASIKPIKLKVHDRKPKRWLWRTLAGVTFVLAATVLVLLAIRLS